MVAISVPLEPWRLWLQNCSAHLYLNGTGRVPASTAQVNCGHFTKQSPAHLCGKPFLGGKLDVAGLGLLFHLCICSAPVQEGCLHACMPACLRLWRGLLKRACGQGESNIPDFPCGAGNTFLLVGWEEKSLRYQRQRREVWEGLTPSPAHTLDCKSRPSTSLTPSLRGKKLGKHMKNKWCCLHSVWL